MSLDFAVQEGIRVDSDSVRVPFVLGDDSKHYSIGQAIVECALHDDSDRSRLHEFYILLNPIESLILGRKFLHEAHVSRIPNAKGPSLGIDDDRESVRTSISLDHIEYSTWQVKATMKHSGKFADTFLVLDKGSDINAISLEYARRINIVIERCRRLEESVRLADGRSTRLFGFADAAVQFSGPASSLGRIPMRFGVIEDLPFDAVLGNPTVEGYQILQDMSSFDWVRLCMLRRSVPKGGLSDRIASPQDFDLLAKYASTSGLTKLTISKSRIAGSGEMLRIRAQSSQFEIRGMNKPMPTPLP